MKTHSLSPHKDGFFIPVMLFLSMVCYQAFCGTHLLEVQPELHFGIVPQESLNTQTITIKNISAVDIPELKAVVSCSCLSVEPNAISLKAGMSASLKVTYRPRSSSGKASNKVFFELKGHDTPVATLVVKADVYRIFESNPRKVDFGIVPLGTSPKSDMQVSPLADRTYKVQDVNFDSLLIEVECDKNAVVSRQSPLKATVILKPDVPVGYFFNDPTDPLNGGIIFSFQDTKTSETFRHTVPFKAFIQGEIEVTPPKYTFPDQPHDAQLTLKVHMRHRQGKSFSITGFTSAFGCTTADFTHEASVEHDVTLHIDTSKIKGNTQDMLRFMTDSEIEKTVKMPVTILFAE